MDTKICSKCDKEKGLSEFYKHKKCKDGVCGYCKECDNKSSKLWRERNPEKVKKNRIVWYKSNINGSNKFSRNWAKNNPEKVKGIHDKYNKKNRDKINNNEKIRRKNNPKKFKNKIKNWIENNLERRREISRNSARKQYKLNKEKRKKIIKESPYLRLRINIPGLVRIKLKSRLLNKNRKSTWSFLPYTVDDLINHLESKFKPWMNWGNYGNKPGCWSIDHIIPDSSFGYKSVEDEEFQKCWALDNLQPLNHIENIRKGNKII